MHVTKHGEDRMIQRLSTSKKNTSKEAEKALERGIRTNETTGNLRRYLDSIFFKNTHCTNIRIYNRNVFLFDTFNNLVTVFALPSTLHAAEDKIKKKRIKNAE